MNALKKAVKITQNSALIGVNYDIRTPSVILAIFNVGFPFPRAFAFYSKHPETLL
jgi:hypothetical protein